MGRSSKTTKGGKFMNPVDQERKLARKKELKKNKIQRENVRKATLLCQDHKELILEMENIDKILFNPAQNPDLNENVLRVKRAKLKDKLTRMIQLYEKEDLNMAKTLKAAESEYLRKRGEMKNFYEQIKRAENVDINSIMLPPEPSKQIINLPPVAQIPLPSQPRPPVQSQRFSAQELKNLKPAGPPPGPPPSWSDIEEEEMENHGPVKSANHTESESMQEVPLDVESSTEDQATTEKPVMSNPVPTPPSGFPPMVPPGHLSMMPRPPPGPPPMVPQRPHGPPPQRHPASMYAWPPGYTQAGPVPPPGLPPSILANKPSRPSHVEAKSSTKAAHSSQPVVISAAPQRRNLKEESTIFMPTALRIKRDNKGSTPANPPAPKNNATADDAFNAFMEEIKQLM